MASKWAGNEENLYQRTQITSLKAYSCPGFHQHPALGTDRCRNERIMSDSPAHRWQREISRAEATMLKAKWSWIYD